MIDSHCHLYLEDFKNDIDQVISTAADSGVSRFYLPAIDSSTHDAMIGLEKKFPGSCFSMMGLHPCSVKENFREEIDIVKDHFSKRKFAAVGETGLDFYWDQTFTSNQYEAFHSQIEIALQFDIPVVIHSRNATKECIDVVSEYRGKGLRGIFHCFGGSIQEAEKIMDCGFFLGIGGVVTYKNSGLSEVMLKVDLKHVVLETDAPYLSPVPYRGKRNESSYLKLIAEKLAEIKSTTKFEVEKITDQNSLSLFR